jgi:hypothetical protein
LFLPSLSVPLIPAFNVFTFSTCDYFIHFCLFLSSASIFSSCLSLFSLLTLFCQYECRRMRSSCSLGVCVSVYLWITPHYVWTNEPVVMKLGTYIMAPDPISTIPPISFCICEYPSCRLLDKGSVKCIPVSMLGNRLVKMFPWQQRVVWGIVFYWVHVVSKESRRLVLSRNSFFSVSVVLLFSIFLYLSF